MKKTAMHTFMTYDQGNATTKGWIVAETNFKTEFQGKAEAILSLGNGYMGVRSATEESYIGQTRNTFVAGTFNKSNSNEVTELPNAADVLGMSIYINGNLFSLEKGFFSNYNRSLNLKTGELLRKFDWQSLNNKTLSFEFRRFTSMADLHTLGSKIKITSHDSNLDIRIKSGINGQVTNSGAQHFEEGEKRIFDKKYLQMLQTTSESKIVFVHNTFHDFVNSDMEISSHFAIDRRQVNLIFTASLSKGQSLEFSKISNIYTTRDKDSQDISLDQLRQHSVDALKTSAQKGYAILLEESSTEWNNLWQQMDITIESTSPYDQLAIRFAQYHLLAMAPKHDNRYGIGAKGLSGEGYKGHSFWDTEIFILPFFSYTFPEIARSLLEYRFITLKGARDKAKVNGYKGAMYPWESAWADDGEVTPKWGAVDVVTGKAMKIWSGDIEQHITSDIAFAVWQYYKISGDTDFMKKNGYEILLDTGIFWGSRLEWNKEKQEYHINNVIGPDEYKEHINNDAFTNYMAKWCMENAISNYEYLKKNEPTIFERLNKKLNLDQEISKLREKHEKIYLPQPNEALIIPQNDTYLQKESIDLEKYKRQTGVDGIFLDYNLDQINEIQVTKQAAVVMLIYLMDHKFNDSIKKVNFDYYEPKTLHDSSLSLSTHAVIAADIGNMNIAYKLFERAARIDLGPVMSSSDKGIHAASLGGIWQTLTCGFGGLRMVNGKLYIRPRLPQSITKISYPFIWKGNTLRVTVTKDDVHVINKGTDTVKVTINHEEVSLTDEVTINLVEGGVTEGK